MSWRGGVDIHCHPIPCPCASKQRIVTGANDGAVGRRLLAINTPLQAVPTRLNGGKAASPNSSDAALERFEAGRNDGFGGAVGERRVVHDGCALEIQPQCGADDKRNVPAACVE